MDQIAITFIKLLFDVSAGPHGVNLVAVAVWAGLAVLAFLWLAGDAMRDNNKQGGR